MNEQYEFTDLSGSDELVDELVAFENKLSNSLGYPVNLIAYNKTGGSVPDSSCRAGLND